jgi:hypothetical protein
LYNDFEKPVLHLVFAYVSRLKEGAIGVIIGVVIGCFGCEKSVSISGNLLLKGFNWSTLGFSSFSQRDSVSTSLAKSSLFSKGLLLLLLLLEEICIIL